MILISILLALASQQSEEFVCSGTDTTRDCRAPDGSTYIERKLGDRLIRKGTAPNGDSWTEYVTKQFDGTRLQGVDSSGKTWFQRCSARTGTVGTDRQGDAVSRPPRIPRAHQPGDTDQTPEPEPCP
jgi:hypothetical protein